MTALRCGTAIALLALAFTASQSAAQPLRGDPRPTVDCETRIQTIGRVPPAQPSDLVAGPVIFRAARALGDEPDSLFEPRGRKPYAPVKVPFIVDADRSATIALAGGSRDHAQIMVGLDQPPYDLRSDAVQIAACPRDAIVGGRRVGPRTAFPAGFRVDGPQCLRLSVLPDGAVDPIRRRLALGRGTCRGDR
jgi:hypothetical protein